MLKPKLKIKPRQKTKLKLAPEPERASKSKPKLKPKLAREPALASQPKSKDKPKLKTKSKLVPAPELSSKPESKPETKPELTPKKLEKLRKLLAIDKIAKNHVKARDAAYRLARHYASKKRSIPSVTCYRIAWALGREFEPLDMDQLAKRWKRLSAKARAKSEAYLAKRGIYELGSSREHYLRLDSNARAQAACQVSAPNEVSALSRCDSRPQES